MSDNLYKILTLENELTDVLSSNKNEELLQNIIKKMNKLLSKINNTEILYLLRNGSSIHEVINIFDYLHEYKINKKQLKEENGYKDELRKLNNYLSIINDSVLNEDEYLLVCNKCNVDNVAEYLLSKMSNNDIMELSNESDDWNYKLFLYGNLKA